MAVVLDFCQPGPRSEIRLLGDLSRILWEAVPGAVASGDSVRLPLDDRSLEVLKRDVFARVGLRKNVQEVEVVSEGAVLFQSYDWFAPDGVLLAGLHSDDMLGELQSRNLVISHTKL